MKKEKMYKTRLVGLYMATAIILGMLSTILPIAIACEPESPTQSQTINEKSYVLSSRNSISGVEITATAIIDGESQFVDFYMSSTENTQEINYLGKCGACSWNNCVGQSPGPDSGCVWYDAMGGEHHNGMCSSYGLCDPPHQGDPGDPTKGHECRCGPRETTQDHIISDFPIDLVQE